MTCAHVVHVALKKMPGVESVEVSLNKGLATVRLHPGNALSVQQFWQTIHQNGYTPKSTVVSVRGELVNAKGQMKLKITGTNEVVDLAADSKNAAAYKTAESKPGQTVSVEGVMVPMKNLKAAVPLEVSRVQ